ncbi:MULTISPECIES: acyltransferase family protein [Actinomadura]|uniref:acyltransferase family protein n=1 Tax=Actinomadura TaxID=1988 RepID=UPI00041018B5|nr:MULTISPECIES: acyltransferase family protein [Actinomadura]RSN68821.1 acyltransferase [Actinomadura sp. WAC 06369]
MVVTSPSSSPPPSGRTPSSGTDAPHGPADPPGRPSARRDAFFDNAKFCAAVLVVVGHVWANFGDSHAVTAAYTVLYAFHMPVFVFISGFFSRGFMRSTDKFRSILPTLVVPYLIFIVPYRLQLVFINGADFDLHELFRPHYLMWFLVAMVFWRLSAPLWSHLRYPTTVSVVLCLIAGSWAFNADGTVARTVGLLPFFVLGLTVDPALVQRLKARWARWAGAAVLVAALPIAYVWQLGTVVPEINSDLLWWNRGYEAMEYSALEGMGLRFAAMLAALLLGAAFLAVIPRNTTWFTAMGARTMFIYLLHGLVVKVFDYGGYFETEALHTPAGIVAVTLGAVALGVLLGTAPVRRLFRWAVEPRADRLLKPRQSRT